MAEEVDKKEEAEESAPEEDEKVSGDLVKEIDGAVDDAMDQIKEESGEGKTKSDADEEEDDVPSEDEAEDEEEEGEKSGDDEEEEEADTPEPISDELLERAVRAGLKIADAKKCPSASMLTDICTTLEAAKESGSDDADSKEGDEEVDPLADFPDLDPDQYDENIVAGFKAMKGITQAALDKIKTLEAAGKDGDKQSWFDSQVSGLGDKVAKALKEAPEKRAKLQDQYEVLAAGYEATGRDVDRGELFKQASESVLGDILSKASDAKKADKLRDRNGQFISRPKSESPKPSTDAFEDVADIIDRKHFGKK